MSAVVKVLILGDDTSLQAALASSKDSLGTFSQQAKAAGDNMQSVGRTLTHAVTVPVLAIAAGATKMAYDFQTNIQKVMNLSSGYIGTQQQVTKTVLDTSTATGQSASDLADAYYKIAAAGYTGATGQQILAQGAQMAAVGMGDAATTTDALLSIVNTYGAANMSASKAADIFTTTVQNSKFAAADLAPVLGRVLPVTAQLGVSFQDLGGDLAALSHTGLSADSAVTGLTALFSNLIAATKQTGNAQKEMKALGLSAKGLMQDLQTHGSIATLDEIKSKLVAAGGAAQYTSAQWQDLANNMGMTVDQVKAQFGKIDLGKLQMLFPNKKAFLTFLGLTDDNNTAAQQAAKNVGATVTGELQKIFGQWSSSDAGKMTLAINAVKNGMIEIGDKILPKLATAVSDIVGWWDKLSPKTKDNAEKFALMAAEVGPVLLVIGKLTSGIGSLAKAFDKSPWALAIGAFVMLYLNSDKFRGAVNDLLSPLKQFGDWVSQHTGLVQALATVIGGTAAAFYAVKTAQTVWAAATAIPKLANELLATSFWQLDAAMDANPIGLIAAAIAILGLTIYECWQHSETFRKGVADLVNALTGAFMFAVKQVSDALIGLGLTFLEVVKGMVSVGNTILGWFGMSLPSGVKNGVDDSISFLQGLQKQIDSLHGTNIQIGVSVVRGGVNTGGSNAVYNGASGSGGTTVAVDLAAAQAAQQAQQDAQNAVNQALSGLAGTGGGSGGGSSPSSSAAKSAATAAANAAKIAAAEANAAMQGKPLLNLEQWMVGGMQNTGKDGPITTMAKNLSAQIKANFTVKGGTVPQAVTDAETALSNLAQQASSFNTTFQNKLASGADFVSVFKGTGAGAGDIKAYLSQQVAELKTYGQDLQALAKKGVPPTLLQQLAAAGLDGMDQVQALMNASPTDLGQIISLGSQISGLSQSIADTAETNIFKPPTALTGALAAGQISSTSTKGKNGHTINVTVNNAQAAKIAKAIAQTLANTS